MAGVGANGTETTHHPKEGGPLVTASRGTGRTKGTHHPKEGGPLVTASRGTGRTKGTHHLIREGDHGIVRAVELGGLGERTIIDEGWTATYRQPGYGPD